MIKQIPRIGISLILVRISGQYIEKEQLLFSLSDPIPMPKRLTWIFTTCSKQGHLTTAHSIALISVSAETPRCSNYTQNSVIFFFSGYSLSAVLKADCHSRSPSRSLSAHYSLSGVFFFMSYERPMQLRSNFTYITTSSSCRRPSSLAFAKVARVPFWRCLICTLPWLRRRKKYTSSTTTRTMAVVLTGTEARCLSPSPIR